MAKAVAYGLALALALAALGATATSAAADEAAEIYDPGAVYVVDLTLSPTEKAKLEAEPDEYVDGTVAITKSADGTPSGEEASPIVPAHPVEIRLKGSVGGSFRDLGEKAAFKLKFKKSEPVLGLRKMTFNNMVQDPSMIHETLAYAAFRAMRVPASRTGFAYLRLNGEGFGVYLDLENLDSVGLGRIFGSPFDAATQHLYEGEKGHDVKPGEATEFEVDEGDEGNVEDLEALIEAVDAEPGPGETWSRRVAPYVDLGEMTRMWAVEKYIDHWDGYSGHAEAGLRPNNYYLYSEPSGRFQMLPWGADQTWIPTIGVGMPWREVTFDGSGGVLFDKCLADDSCAARYRRVLRELLATVGSFGLDSLAARTAALLEPWQALETAPRRPADSDEIEAAVDETESFAAGRAAELRAFLAGQPPELPAAAVAVAVEPGSIAADGASEATVTARVTGAAGEPIFGDQIVFSASDAGVHFGPVVDEGEGILRASLTGSAAPGTVTITATDTTAGLSATTTLTQSGSAAEGGSGTVAPGGSPAAAPAPGLVAPVARPTRPRTHFTRVPGHRIRTHRPLFAFAAEQPGATFRCRVDRKRFRACRSPYRPRGLRVGKHSFAVRAVTASGPGPAARYRFFISPRRARKAHRAHRSGAARRL